LANDTYSFTAFLRAKANYCKEIPGIILPFPKILSARTEIVPICYFLRLRKRKPIMGISMSSSTSGFRKWSEAHDPKIADARGVAGEAAVIPVPDLDQGMMTPEEQPHRPWLVPGSGTL
jgi:hypothetical protein